MKEILPAILTDNASELRDTLKKLRDITEWVHIDIMDGKFVEQKTIVVNDLADAGAHTKLEIHLMVNNPESFFSDCADIKAERVIFHAEASEDLARTIDAMNAYGYERGIALNPDTPVNTIRPHLEMINEILMMSVNPGKQAQTFIATALSKIHELKKLASSVAIGVDGGIKVDNISDVVAAGADRCVVGSGIVKADDMASALAVFNQKIS